MALRPLATSVVLAAALLGTSVIRGGGAATDGGASAGSTPPPSAETPGASSPASPAPSAGGPVSSPATGPTASPPPEPGTALPRVWRHGARTQKLVALTFDDGWNLDDVRAIVRILDMKQAPATFFPVARAVQRHPNTWRAIAAAGFPIGNHSWNHDDLTKKTPQQATQDLRRATAAIEQVIGVPMLPVVRPPYGSYDDGTIAAAGAAGMDALILWDIDTSDWSGAKPAKVAQTATHAISGSIVVMHTDKDNTVKALPKIIDVLRTRGYTLVTVGQLIGIPGDVPVFSPRAQRAFQDGR